MMNGLFMSKERQNWPNPTSVGGLDPYSNDAIPAMQLLSLMDQSIPSGSSLKIGPPKNFMNKTFGPCSNHPPANRNENQNLFNGLFASQNGQYKDFLQSFYGVGPLVKRAVHLIYIVQYRMSRGVQKVCEWRGLVVLRLRKKQVNPR